MPPRAGRASGSGTRDRKWTVSPNVRVYRWPTSSVSCGPMFASSTAVSLESLSLSTKFSSCRTPSMLLMTEEFAGKIDEFEEFTAATTQNALVPITTNCSIYEYSTCVSFRSTAHVNPVKGKLCKK